MNLSQTHISNSPEETLEHARKFGETLKPSTVILLSGGLGAGKTLFTKGITLGLGLVEIWEVDSPTYTIMKTYGTKPPVIHYDLYRISDESELEDLSFFDMMDSTAIKIIEWPERLKSYCLTQDGFIVHLEKTGIGQRTITIHPVKSER
jgi:tRNA threonylcarbamoyladenosine biosynthesis protein TsaE